MCFATNVLSLSLEVETVALALQRRGEEFGFNRPLSKTNVFVRSPTKIIHSFKDIPGGKKGMANISRNGRTGKITARQVLVQEVTKEPQSALLRSHQVSLQTAKIRTAPCKPDELHHINTPSVPLRTTRTRTDGQADLIELNSYLLLLQCLFIHF